MLRSAPTRRSVSDRLSGSSPMAAAFVLPPPHPGRVSSSSGRARQSNSSPSSAVRDILDDVEGPGVGPVDVLDDEDERLFGGAEVKVAANGPGQLPFAKVQLGECFADRAKAGHDAEPSRDRPRILVRIAKRSEDGRAQLACGFLEAILKRDGRVRANDLAERPIGEALAVWEAAAPPDARRVHVADEVADQSGLPGAGGTEHRDKERPRRACDATVGIDEELHLLVSANERRIFRPRFRSKRRRLLEQPRRETKRIPKPAFLRA